MDTHLWMSFVNRRLPPDEQFLGAVIVEGTDLKEATKFAWNKGINPGGEILFLPFNFEEHPEMIDYPKNKLMSQAEIESIGPIMRV